MEMASRLDRYATAFGMAFQLADDLLDFLGDEIILGKPTGTDIKAGVYTLPLLHAIGSGVQASELLSDIDLPRVVKRLQESGSFSYTRSVAERYAAQALDELSGLPECAERDVLESLVELMVLRRIPVSSAA
jgi:heptaprenyl diphosphate synthase